MKFVKACAIVLFGCINKCNAAGAVLSDADDMIQGEVQVASVSTIELRQRSHVCYILYLHLISGLTLHFY